MKKMFETIGFLALICVSFFYTSSIQNVIVSSDDLMKEIERMKEQYDTASIDALIEGNTIIPGLSGSEVDALKSYQKMKKIGSFQPNLFVYKKIMPSVSSYRVYDKYIIHGNPKKKQAALLFLVNDKDDVLKITKLLKEEKATFFIDGTWFENNNQEVIDLIQMGHIVGNLGYQMNYQVSGIAWMNTIVTKIGKQKNSYCYNEVESSENLKVCTLNESYTIRPNIIAHNTPFITVEKNIENGSIISLDINDTTIKELPLIIDYLHSKDISLVTIEELLTE